MMRLVGSLVVVLTVGYVLLVVRLEERPVVAHLVDIWRCPTVQEKVRLVQQAMASRRGQPEVRFPDLRLPPGPPQGAAPEAGHPTLDTLLEQVSAHDNPEDRARRKRGRR